MHYKFLSELGHHYSAEEGKEGVRRVALTDLEMKYNQAVVNLNALLAGRPPAPTVRAGAGRPQSPYVDASGRVKPKVTPKFTPRFQPKLAAVTEVQPDTPEIARARALVDRARRHLTMQGAEIGPDGKIDWGLSKRTVVYDRDLAARDATKLKYSGGKMYLDAAFQTPLDTRQMVTMFSGPGFGIYVMSEEGHLHVSSHSVGHRHHSSLLAGGTVAGAGELVANDGRLIWISNKSGHYYPSTPHFIQTLHELQRKNIDLSSVKVRFHTATGKGDYASVGEFLSTLRFHEADYHTAKLLRYLMPIPIGDFNALAATRGWRWHSSINYTGVVECATGNPVHAKVVIGWLKGQGIIASAEKQSGQGR